MHCVQVSVYSGICDLLVRTVSTSSLLFSSSSMGMVSHRWPIYKRAWTGQTLAIRLQVRYDANDRSASM